MNWFQRMEIKEFKIIALNFSEVKWNKNRKINDIREKTP